MFDAGKLLGALMQGGLKGSTGGQRLENAINKGGGGGLLGQLSGGVLGGLLNNVTKGGGIMGALSDLAGGSRSGSSTGGGAMGILGTIALQVIQSKMGGSSSGASSSMQLMAGLREPENDAENRQLQDLSVLTIRAMINAAKADGEVDQEEMQRIAEKLRDAGDEANEFVRNELNGPMDTDSIVNAVPNQQVGAQIYSASLLAIEVDSYAEKEYLQELSRKLQLDQGTVEHIHTMLDVEY